MRLFMISIIVFVFSACGKTGDLILPEENRSENAPTEVLAVKSEPLAAEQ